MSAPVRIPAPRVAAVAGTPGSSSSSSSSSSPFGGAARSYASRNQSPGSASSPLSVGFRAEPEVRSEEHEWRPGTRERRESLIGPLLAEQTHTVIDTSRPDGPPRITSFVRAAQGFEWNPDMFLPTHSPLWGAGAGDRLERRRDDVVDVVLSDEEAADLLPQ